MKPLFSEEEYNNTTFNKLLPCECYRCGKIFYKTKKLIYQRYENIKLGKVKYSNSCLFCSNTCRATKDNCHDVKCKNCNKEFQKKNSQALKHINHFCSRSCAAIYNNTHKTTGTRRSKLEVWLEEQLTILYPNIAIDFNKKDAINSELDIYIPSLNLAFELNGIYHYKPIHGQDKLNQVQNNDLRKFKSCTEKDISLCIINTSSVKHFTPINSNQFLTIIVNNINNAKLLQGDLNPQPTPCKDAALPD